MKRIAATLVVLIIMSTSLFAFAYTEEVEIIYDEAAKSFYKDLPDSAKDSIDGEETINIFEKIKELLYASLSDIKNTVKTPLKMLGIVVAVMMVFSLASSLSEAEGASKAVKLTAGLAAAVCLASYTTGYFEELGETLDALKNLAFSFIPAFAGVCSGTGLVTASVAYSGAALICTQTVCVFVLEISKPFLGVMMALSVAGSAIDWFDTGAFVKGLSKLIKWFFSIGSTTFLIITTLQNTIAASVDTATLAAGRFMFNTVIPVVGSSFSETGATMLSSMKIVKGNVGAVGIIGIIALILPVLLRYICFALSLKGASAVASLLGMTSMSKMIDGVCECIAFCIAAISSVSLMLLFMTAVMITVGNH